MGFEGGSKIRYFFKKVLKLEPPEKVYVFRYFSKKYQIRIPPKKYLKIDTFLGGANNRDFSFFAKNRVFLENVKNLLCSKMLGPVPKNYNLFLNPTKSATLCYSSQRYRVLTQARGKLQHNPRVGLGQS